MSEDQRIMARAVQRKHIRTLEARVAELEAKLEGAEMEIRTCEKEVLGLQEHNAELEGALRKLTNEAEGFVSMADPWSHGATNIAVLTMRIEEARASLATKPGGER